MNKIKVMPMELANQIAAGEVVTRPAAIVKELVENALDAQATKIIIDVFEGGIAKIIVDDNGVGMSPRDAELAFQRHATSKLFREHELKYITTLGFRGEALPSIAAVSEVQLTTANKDTELATNVFVIGGVVKKIEDSTRSVGTQIVIKKLFYNTPARLKFLKSVPTELAHIADIVGKLALSHPNCSFSLQHDGRAVFATPARGRLEEVCHALYGLQVAEQLLPVKAIHNEFGIEGVIAKPEVNRANRNYCSFFLNQRYVRSLVLSRAILNAYATLLPRGRFPVGVINITLDPQLMDINVHPAKLEVRLSKEQECCTLLTSAVKGVLLKQDLIPDYQITTPSIQRSETVVRQQKLDLRSPVLKPEPVERGAEPRAELNPQTVKAAFPMMEPLAQVEGTYIVAQGSEGFYLIDQHAAHERIFYEEFLKKLTTKKLQSHMPLMPLMLEASHQEVAVIISCTKQLLALGLELESFGQGTYLVRKYPDWFQAEQVAGWIHEILALLERSEKISVAELRDEQAKLMACKAAIKAHQKLSKAEMEMLILNLSDCQERFTCPHGRPIFIHFSKYQLEKMFKRIM
ncbi:MAG: mismatch repair protein MutL [Bacillota bacterium]